jgi:hypothetical protein
MPGHASGMGTLRPHSWAETALHGVCTQEREGEAFGKGDWRANTRRWTRLTDFIWLRCGGCSISPATQPDHPRRRFETLVLNPADLGPMVGSWRWVIQKRFRRLFSVGDLDALLEVRIRESGR